MRTAPFVSSRHRQAQSTPGDAGCEFPSPRAITPSRRRKRASQPPALVEPLREERLAEDVLERDLAMGEGVQRQAEQPVRSRGERLT